MMLKIALNLSKTENFSTDDVTFTEPSSYRIPIMIKVSLSRPLPSGAVVMPVITMPIVLVVVAQPLHSINNISSVTVSAAATSSSDVRTERNQQDSDSDSQSLVNLMSIGTALSASCIRQASVGLQSVMALECPGMLGIGGKVWDSTFVLLDYLNRNKTLVQGKTIVELGSGTGLAGIVINTIYYDICLIILLILVQSIDN